MKEKALKEGMEQKYASGINLVHEMRKWLK